MSFSLVQSKGVSTNTQHGLCQFSHPVWMSLTSLTLPLKWIYSLKRYITFPKKPQLNKIKEKLIAYDGNEIPVIGKCVVHLQRKRKQNSPVQMFVVPTNSSPIIALETCQRLNLIKRVESLKYFNSDIIRNHNVFGVIGCLPGEHIQIDENAVIVVYLPRRVPYPLRNKLKSDLDPMQQLDIIKENWWTDWMGKFAGHCWKANWRSLCLGTRWWKVNITQCQQRKQ